jgi:prepilin-type N-terminal cleavage/methylation domain-containing protein
MNMKKKGFTLIELLAVIVILAVIALITTPTILGVIETARKGSAESSALGYIDAVEKQIAINTLDSSKTQLVDGTYTVEQLTNAGVTVKGESPEYTEENKSWVKIEKNQVVDYSLKFDEYVVNCDEKTNAPIATKNGTLKDMESTSTISSGPTKVNAQEGETHKGIVYLDPTDLTKTCNAENSVSTTETKTGCMKWYIYSEDNSTYTMILDHNTTALVAWVSKDDYISAGGTETDYGTYGNTNKGPITVQKQLTNDTSSWDNSLNARLITADEVATITGNTAFNSETSTSGNQYWLETNSTIEFNDQGIILPSSYSKAYAWLTDYTSGCSDYGCNIEDNNSYVYDGININNTYGYWTSTPVAGNPNRAWGVNGYDALRYSYVRSANGVGLRPVITVSKDIFE